VAARSLVDKEDAYRAILCYNTNKWITSLGKHTSFTSLASKQAGGLMLA